MISEVRAEVSVASRNVRSVGSTFTFLNCVISQISCQSELKAAVVASRQLDMQRKTRWNKQTTLISDWPPASNQNLKTAQKEAQTSLHQLEKETKVLWPLWPV